MFVPLLCVPAQTGVVIVEATAGFFWDNPRPLSLLAAGAIFTAFTRRTLTKQALLRAGRLRPAHIDGYVKSKSYGCLDVTAAAYPEGQQHKQVE